MGEISEGEVDRGDMRADARGREEVCTGVKGYVGFIIGADGRG